jgi:hypothetical protein
LPSHFRGKFGKVLYYENSTSFLGKTSGPRVQVLVKDSTKILERVRIKGASPRIFHGHKIVVTGHPNQCVRCHVIGHNLKNCPQLLEERTKWQSGGEKREGEGEGCDPGAIPITALKPVLQEGYSTLLRFILTKERRRWSVDMRCSVKIVM